MAEVYSFPSRFNHRGAERLAKALEHAITTGADLGPRWPQIQALGLSLRQLTQDLEQAADRMAFEPDPTPELDAFRDSLYQLVGTFSRLGSIAQAYRSDIHASSRR